MPQVVHGYRHSVRCTLTKRDVFVQPYRNLHSRKFSSDTGTHWSRWQQYLREGTLQPWQIRLRLFYRFTRMVVFGYTIFSVGKHVGAIEYAWDPVGFMRNQIRNAISVDVDKVHDPIRSSNSPEHKRCERIVGRLLQAAEIVVKERLEAAEAAEAEGDSAPETKLEFAPIASMSDSEDWALALNRLQSGEWTVVVVNNSSPNAFVTGMVPRVIFVHQGLMSSTASDEELAFVLAHEISHSLMRHSLKGLEETALLLVTVMAVIASLDPTATLSLGAEMMVWPLLRYGISLPHSRHHESEADSLGLEISSKACYHPKGAHSFFTTLAALEQRYGGSSRKWSSTHPRTEDRDSAVLDLARSKVVAHNLEHCLHAPHERYYRVPGVRSLGPGLSKILREASRSVQQ